MFRTNTFCFFFIGDQNEKMKQEAKRELIPSTLTMTHEKIQKFTFPTYVPPNVKDDMVIMLI